MTITNSSSLGNSTYTLEDTESIGVVKIVRTNPKDERPVVFYCAREAILKYAILYLAENISKKLGILT